MKFLLVISCIVILLIVGFVACSRKIEKKPSTLEKEYPKSIDEILAQPEELDIIFALHEKIDQKWAKSGLDSLTPAEKIFLCVEGIEGEVNNGGFDQYFTNSAGDLAQDAPAAFEVIGAKYTASLVRKACSVFPDGLPHKNRENRHEQLSQIGENGVELLCQLDSQFYESKENVFELLIDYIRKNKDQFK